MKCLLLSLVFQKELGDKNNAATDQIRQLLPLPKQTYDVITVEPYGAVLDNKGNRVQTFDAIGKKPVSKYHVNFTLLNLMFGIKVPILLLFKILFDLLFHVFYFIFFMFFLVYICIYLLIHFLLEIQ